MTKYFLHIIEGESKSQVHMIMCACALTVMTHSHPVIDMAVDHHCSYTVAGGAKTRFQTEPETSMDNYKMICDLSKWAGGSLPSDVLYSLYADEDGNQLKAMDVIGNEESPSSG